MSTESFLPPEQMGSCANCSALAPLRIENFLAGKLRCPACATTERFKVMAREPRCPHGRPVSFYAPGASAPFCAECAA